MTKKVEQLTQDHDMFAVYRDDTTGAMVMDQPDPETGELRPVPVGDLPIPKRLTGMAFAIRNAEMARDQQLALLAEQRRIIQAHEQRVNEVADKFIGQLTSMGSGLLDQLHEKGEAAVDAKKRPRLQIAGVGTWAKLTTKRATVDTKAWADMNEDQQGAVALAHPDLFVVDTIKIIKADGRAILKALQSGKEIDGFTLNPAEDHYTFKPEKGTGLPPVGVVAEDQAGD